jgi:hypothetical protein
MDRLAILIFISLNVGCLSKRQVTNVIYNVPDFYNNDLPYLMCNCSYDYSTQYKFLIKHIEQENLPKLMGKDTLDYCMIYGSSRIVLYPMLHESLNKSKKKMQRKYRQFILSYAPSLRFVFTINSNGSHNYKPAWFYKITSRRNADSLVVYDALTINEIQVNNPAFIKEKWPWSPITDTVLRPTGVLQKWGICTKFKHWNSNQH